MNITELMTEHREEILTDAHEALARPHVPHYDSAGEEVTRDRLAVLADLVADAVAERDLTAITTYCTKLAGERFHAGFDISEVQAAFNALELVLWHQIVAGASPEDLAEAIGMLSTVLGHSKDTLAREWVSLSSQRHVSSLDLSALFTGAAASL